jgi:hypothetical protein
VGRNGHTPVMVCVAILVLLAHVGTAQVSSLFTATKNSTASSFVGAMFSPNVAPTVQASRQGANVELIWSAVKLGARVVDYVVWRVEGSKWTHICLGADAPVTTAGTVTCRDRRAAQGGKPTFRYAVQPVHMVGGIVTWSLAPGVPQPVR